ncbi:MAG: MATE family efflux transporter [Pseudomonadales bacterium]
MPNTTHKPLSDWRTVWSLAIPSGAVFFFFTLANLATIKIVADLGPDAIAAVTTGQRLYNIFAAAIAGLSTGTLALVARHWGAGDREAASRTMTAAAVCAALAGALVSLIIWPTAPLLVGLFGLNNEASALSIDFLRYFSLFYFPIAVYMVLATGLRAAGDARKPMIYAVAMAILIVINVQLFTYGTRLFPGGGIIGTAIGSGMANLLVMLAAFMSWWRGRFSLKFRFVSEKLLIDLRNIWRIGLPTMLEQGVMQIGFIGFLWVVGHFGTAAYAAYGTGVSLLSLTMVIGLGFSMAGSILVGQNLGANQPEEAKRAAWRAIQQSVISLTLFGILIAPFSRYLAEWLVGPGPVAEHTITFLYVLCIAQPFMGLDFALTGALRGAGDTRFPLVSAIIGLVVFRFGLASVLLYFDAPLYLVYATLIADYAVKNIVLLARFRSGRWMKTVAH